MNGQLGFNLDDPTELETVEEKKAKLKAEKDALKKEEKTLNDARTSLKSKLEVLSNFDFKKLEEPVEEIDSTDAEEYDDSEEESEDDDE